MKTDSKKQMIYNILNNIIYASVCFLAIKYGNPNHFWKTVFTILGVLFTISLISFIKRYYFFITNKSTDNSKSTDYGKTFNEKYSSIINNKKEIQKAYELLDLKLTDDIPTIKKRYRFLAMQWHPDKFSKDRVENQQIAKRNFQKVNSAYNVVKKYKKFV